MLITPSKDRNGVALLNNGGDQPATDKTCRTSNTEAQAIQNTFLRIRLIAQ